MGASKINTTEVQKIQIDHGIVYVDYGETSQRLLAPTRGGGEFKATVTVRDIEFDGRNGKTAGMQVIEENAASLAVTLLGMTQENLRLAIPGAKAAADDTTGAIKNPKVGIIADDKYWKNIVMFAKTLDGKYKKITIFNPMSEGELSIKTQHKAEGELGIELVAHYTLDDLDGDLWEVVDAETMEAAAAQAAAAAETGAETGENNA